MLRRLSLLYGILCCLPIMAMAQAPVTVTLAWDYPPNAIATEFVLERATGQGGTFARVGNPIPLAARQVQDAVISGQIYAWRLLAVLRVGDQVYTSVPSNVVTDAVVVAPITLRVMP